LWAALYGRGGRIDVEAMADSWTEVVLHGIQPAARRAQGQFESRLARLEKMVATRARAR
jgi:hypothetical protein